jgi:hypothetical protein
MALLMLSRHQTTGEQSSPLQTTQKIFGPPLKHCLNRDFIKIFRIFQD